jgi:hypothetical protein
MLRPWGKTSGRRHTASVVRSVALGVMTVALLLSSKGASDEPAGIAPSTAPPLAQELRTQQGTVGLLSEPNPARFSFEKAEGKVEYAGDQAGNAAGSMLAKTTGDPLANAVLGVATLALAPVAAVDGAISARKRLSQDKLSECEANLVKAMQEMALQERFHSLLTKVAHEKYPGRLVPVEHLQSTGFDRSPVDAMLRARVEELRLERTGSGDSSYVLLIKTRARLVRLADGAVLHDQPAEYRSGTCLFVDWTLHNAFQNVAETGYRKLAERMVDQLLATTDMSLLVGAGYRKAPAQNRRPITQLASNQTPLNPPSVQLASYPLADAGRLGIYSTARAPQIAFQKPSSREEATSEAIADVEWMLDGLDKHPNPMVALPASAVAVPISLWKQGIAIVRGLSPRALRAAEAKLNTVATQTRLEEKLAFLVAQRLTPLSSHPVMLVNTTLPPGPKHQAALLRPVSGATPVKPTNGRTGAGLPVGPGPDTVLETCVQSVALTGDGGINPKLALSVVVQATLRRSLDGQALYSTPVHYRSEGRQFTKWAAHDAKLFRAELEQCYRDLSAAIVDQLGRHGFAPQDRRPQPFLVKNVSGKQDTSSRQ